MTMRDKIKELQDYEEKMLQMGGEKGISKQKEKGKLTARDRKSVV